MATLLTKNKYPWIEDDRVPSQAEIDYYGAMDTGETPEITQEHLDEIQVGGANADLSNVELGDFVPSVNDNGDNEEPEELPGFTSEHNAGVEGGLWTIDEDTTGPTDTTMKRQGGAGGYGKKRVGEESRRQMNLTGKKRSSILTS